MKEKKMVPKKKELFDLKPFAWKTESAFKI